MKGMPFTFAGKGISVPTPEIIEAKWKKASSEPTSVLDTHRSPSPTSTSTLSSSFGGGSDTTGVGGIAAVSGNQLQKWPAAGEPVKEEWPVELIGKCAVVMDEWENMIIQSSAVSETHENSLLRLMMGEVDDPLKLNQVSSNGNIANGSSTPFDSLVEGGFAVDPAALGFGSGLIDASFSGGGGFPLMAGVTSVSEYNPCSIAAAGNGIEGSGSVNNSVFVPSTNLSLPVGVPPGNFYPQLQPEPILAARKPQMNLFSNPPATDLGFLLPEMPPAKRHHPLPLVKYELQQMPHSKKVEFSDSGQDLLSRQQQPKQEPVPLLQQRPRSMPADLVADEATQLAIVDQLHRAAELVESGNSAHARAILARLNHHLSAPVGKPLYRAAFYFKEVLLRLSGARPVLDPAVPVLHSPRDVVPRIGAFKAFFEISPLMQFASFTCNQAILEALTGPAAIHILDFDIGIGVHWASFIQEIAPKVVGGAHYSLKITAFTSPSSHDQLELALTRENLSNFACALDIPFEFHAVNLDSFDPSVLILRNSSEVLFANLPSSAHRLFPSTSLPSLLQFVRQLSPKIVVSADYACDGADLSFAQHFLHGLQFYSLLFESLSAMNVNFNTLGKVESLLMKPKIEKIVAGRYHASDKLPPWQNLFISAGFKPVPFSNYSETQAECLLKRFNLQGFHIEKHQTSLLLLWHRRELMSASVWTC